MYSTSPEHEYDYEYDEHDLGGGKKQRKSVKGRRLMRWNVDVDQLVLLSVEYICARDGVAIPWDEVAGQVNDYLSGEAIKQHLTKVRKARQEEGLQVPPVLDRNARRKAIVAAADAASSAGQTKSHPKSAKYEEEPTVKRSTLLPPPPIKTTGRKKAMVANTNNNKGARHTKVNTASTRGRGRRNGVTAAPKRGRGVSFDKDEDEDGSYSPTSSPSKRARRSGQPVKYFKEPSPSDHESADEEMDGVEQDADGDLDPVDYEIDPESLSLPTVPDVPSEAQDSKPQVTHNVASVHGYATDGAADITTSNLTRPNWDFESSGLSLPHGNGSYSANNEMSSGDDVHGLPFVDLYSRGQPRSMTFPPWNAYNTSQSSSFDMGTNSSFENSPALANNYNFMSLRPNIGIPKTSFDSLDSGFAGSQQISPVTGQRNPFSTGDITEWAGNNAFHQHSRSADSTGDHFTMRDFVGANDDGSGPW